MIVHPITRKRILRIALEEAVNITIGLALLIALVSVLHGCNTMEGAGKDLEEAGEAIEDAAD